MPFLGYNQDSQVPAVSVCPANLLKPLHERFVGGFRYFRLYDLRVGIGFTPVELVVWVFRMILAAISKYNAPHEKQPGAHLATYIKYN